MAQIKKLVAQFKENPKNVGFNDLVKVCNHYFGDARQSGSSHYVYKTPWQGDPRVNIQNKKRFAIILSSKTDFSGDRENRGDEKWLTTNTIATELSGLMRMRNT